MRNLKMLHRITVPYVHQKVLHYVETLGNTYNIKYNGVIPNGTLYSITPIKVYKHNAKYIVFDGNARIMAYNRFFTNSPLIEVDVYA